MSLTQPSWASTVDESTPVTVAKRFSQTPLEQSAFVLQAQPSAEGGPQVPRLVGPRAPLPRQTAADRIKLPRTRVEKLALRSVIRFGLENVPVVEALMTGVMTRTKLPKMPVHVAGGVPESLQR